MRTLFALMAVAVLTPAAWAGVWVGARYYAEKTPLETVDPNTPTVYRDIMVGTHLTIVVSSDQAGYWSGGLQMDWADEPYCVLSGRGFVAKPMNYKDSCLEAAGQSARVISSMASDGLGFNFFSTHLSSSPYYRGSEPGDWFIFDYLARQTGSCNIALLDFALGFNVPVQTLTFTHVPTRDFNADHIVDFADFAVLAARWQSTPQADPNSPAAAPDLDADSSIDVNDLALFSDFWLERTAAPKPPADPNAV